MKPANPRRLGSTLASFCLLASTGPATAAPQALPVMMYEVVTETGMPHLEENLRYAVRNERRCIDPQELSTAFWMLGEVSLQDCKLAKSGSDAADSASYLLQCSGGYGTSGGAQWQLEPDRITGMFKVRLGAKNMTFYQRIVARPIGACP